MPWMVDVGFAIFLAGCGSLAIAAAAYVIVDIKIKLWNWDRIIPDENEGD